LFCKLTKKLNRWILHLLAICIVISYKHKKLFIYFYKVTTNDFDKEFRKSVVNINQLFGSTSKKSPVGIDVQSQGFLSRGGFVKFVNNQIVYLPITIKIFQHVHDLLIGLFSDVSSNEIVIQESCDVVDFLDLEFSSYKQLPSILDFKTREEFSKYQYNRGLLNSQSALFQNYVRIGIDEFDIQSLQYKITTLCNNFEFTLSWVQFVDDDRFGVIEHPLGNTKFVHCSTCDSNNHIEVSNHHRIINSEDKVQEIEEVHTPNAKTIKELADFLSISEKQCAKVVFYMGDFDTGSKLIICVVRGDHEVSELKLRRILKLDSIRPADDVEIKDVGCYPGYASPIGIDRSKCKVVVDEYIPKSTNMVVGANKQHYHLINSNYSRDYTADITGDIIQLPDNAYCNLCNNQLVILKGILVFTLSTLHNSIKILNQTGKNSIPDIIQLKLNYTSLLGGIAELNHNKFGVVLPIKFAPIPIIIIVLSKVEKIQQQAKDYQIKLNSKNISAVIDNRDIRAGQLFADADLHGFPIRVTYSNKLHELNQIELKVRSTEVVIVESEEEILKQIELLCL